MLWSSMSCTSKVTWIIWSTHAVLFVSLAPGVQSNHALLVQSSPTVHKHPSNSTIQKLDARYRVMFSVGLVKSVQKLRRYMTLESVAISRGKIDVASKV